MSKNRAAVVYWSATGNTELMAHAVARGLRRGGAQADIYQAIEFTRDKMDCYDEIAFGCPSYNEDSLEQGEFEPMFASIEDKLNGKKIALFGTYGWGGDRWMKKWIRRVEKDGAELINDRAVICKGTPDNAVLDQCITLGQELAL